jgi:hypothetical protein
VTLHPIFKNVKINIYKNIILLKALYKRETSPLTLREEHKLRESENKVPREIYMPKREKEEDGETLPRSDLHDFILLLTKYY